MVRHSQAPCVLLLYSLPFTPFDRAEDFQGEDEREKKKAKALNILTTASSILTIDKKECSNNPESHP
jgi:hypothetical protein